MTEVFAQKYEFLVNNILDTIIEIDLKGNFIYISPQCFDIFGFYQNELIGKNSFDFIHPDDLSNMKKIISNAILKKKPILAEFRTKHKEGHYVYISTRGSLVNFNGKQTIIAVGRDITKQKIMEQKLKESEDIFNKITDQTYLGFVILQDFYIKYTNLAFSEAIGYSQEEIINWEKADFLKIIHPDDKEVLFSLAKKVYSGDNEALNSYQFHMIKKSGDPIWSEVHTKPILYKGEKADLVFIQDITEKKIAEEKLRESEEKYRLITEHANDLIDVLNEKFQYEYINEKVHKRVLGYSEEDMLGKYAGKFVHPDDMQFIIKKLKEGFVNGVGMAESRIRKKDGSYIWYESKGNVYRDKNGNKKALIISRDITDRKITDDKILKNEALLSEAQRIAHLGHWEWNILTNEMFWSDELYRIYDRPNDYKPNIQEWLPYVHPDDFKIYFKSLRENISSGNIHNKDFRIITSSGVIKYIHAEWEITRDNKNKPIRAFGTILDITERKLAELKLKESEKNYRNLVSNIPGVVFRCDQNWTMQYISNNIQKISGFPPSHFIFNTVRKYADIIHPDDIKKVGRTLIDSIEKKNPVELEYRIICNEGKVKWVQDNSMGIFNENGEFIGFTGVIIDITDRKRAEHKLKESEEKYRLITENANDLIAILNDQFEHEFINEQTYLNLLGYSNKDMLGEKKWEIIHPDDFTLAIENLRDGFRTGEGINELRLRHKQGYYLWFEFKGKKYLNTEGKIKGLLIARDITQRKMVDLKLRESEEKFRNIIENTKEGYFEVDLEGNFTFFNDAFCKLFEYSPDELLGMNYREYTTKEMSRKTFTAFNKVFKTRIEQNIFEYEVIAKNGKIVYGETSIHLRHDTEGNIIGFSGFLRDVTEKKIAEDKLRESEEKYRHIIENSPFAIILIDLEGSIKDCNSVTSKIFGFTKEELVNKNYLELSVLHSDQIPLIKERFNLLKKGESLESAEFQIYTKNRKKLWITSRLSQIKIGNQSFFFAIIEDITEKKILENIMFELNQNFFHFSTDVKKNIQLLLQTTKNLSKGSLILYIRQYSNKNSDDIEILSSEDEIYNFDLEVFRSNIFIKELLEQTHEIPQIFSEVNEREDLMTIRFVQKYNLKGAYGKIINTHNEFKSAICIFYEQTPDITYEDQLVLLLISDAIAIEEQRWQLLQKLEEQNKKLSEIDKLKSELLRRISHELKTPLISIKGYADLILQQNKDFFDIDTISMMGEINNGCLRLENLISELMKSSKLESGQIELKPITDNLTFLIKFTAKELEGLAKSRNQDIVLNIQEDLITKFEKERIHEVIGNLLTNAIKYTPPYGTIKIASEIREKFYIISVKDNGIGFTGEEKKNIFRQFGKIERYGRGSYISTEGTGLGLYICKKLIELHGGEIWMESEGRYKGSTFYFSLPIIKE